MADLMIGSGEWATELCRALGGNPSLNRKFTLMVEVGTAVTVTFEQFVNKDDGIIEIIKKVAWIEDEESSIMGVPVELNDSLKEDEVIIKSSSANK